MYNAIGLIFFNSPMITLQKIMSTIIIFNGMLDKIFTIKL